jgi:soluble lytic murein transglycosylase
VKFSFLGLFFVFKIAADEKNNSVRRGTVIFLKNKKVLVRAAVLFGAIAIVEACVFPLHIAISDRHPSELEISDNSGLSYIAGILRESRTGLDAVDEIRLAEVILNESVANGLDPLLMMAVIKTESTFYNWARSYKGAMGLMQIMPSTGRWVAEGLDLEWDSNRMLFNPYLNVRLGVRYFSMLRERYGNDTMLMLAAYNAGPTSLSELIRRGGKPPQRYANKVLANYKDLQEKAGYN